MTCACSSIVKVDTSSVDQVGTINKINTLGEVSSISEVRNTGFYWWRAPIYDDAGVVQQSTWQKVAAVAVATISTLMSIRIAKKQLDIADGYYALFKEHADRYYNVYAPVEREYMTEVGNADPYVPDYDGRGGLYKSLNEVTQANVQDNLSYFATLVPVCLASTILDRYQLDTGSNSLAVQEIAMRQEDKDKITKDDRRWKYRAQGLDRGRSLLKTSTDYAQKASGIYGELQQTVTGAAQGAAGALGYFGSRKNTSYPVGLTARAALDYNGNEFTRSTGNVGTTAGLTNPVGNYANI